MRGQVQSIHAPLQKLLLAPFRWLIFVKLMGILAILLCLLQRSEPLALLYCKLCPDLMHHELFKWWPRARLEVHFIVHRHVLAALLDLV